MQLDHAPNVVRKADAYVPKFVKVNHGLLGEHFVLGAGTIVVSGIT